MPRREITRTMPRFNGKDIDDLDFPELKLLVAALLLRVTELEELTGPVRRDRAVRRVLAGKGTPRDAEDASFFLAGPKP